jgi:hypothetical protein
LKETVESQALKIKALEETVAKTCSQLTTVATQVNKLAVVVAGVTLLNALNLGGLGLSIPKLPEALPATTC